MARLSERFSRHALGLEPSPAGPSFAAPPLALTELPLTQIEPDPDQPRRDLGDLTELAASIRALGVIQPIIVAVVGYERYRILAGERRFSAARLAELDRIPAIVRTVEEQRRLEIQLVENLHRKDLNPFEEAHTYQRLLAEFGLTQEVLGRRLGRTQASVAETLRVLDLPDAIQREALSGEGAAARLSKSLLLEIARRPRAEQTRLWEEAKRGDLSVRRIRAARAGGKRKASGHSPARYPIALREQDAEVVITFAQGRLHLENVVAALEEALTIERARLVG